MCRRASQIIFIIIVIIVIIDYWLLIICGASLECVVLRRLGWQFKSSLCSLNYDMHCKSFICVSHRIETAICYTPFGTVTRSAGGWDLVEVMMCLLIRLGHPMSGDSIQSSGRLWSHCKSRKSELTSLYEFVTKLNSVTILIHVQTALCCPHWLWNPPSLYGGIQSVKRFGCCCDGHLARGDEAIRCSGNEIWRGYRVWRDQWHQVTNFNSLWLLLA